MSTEEKILKLVQGLLAKTKSGDVIWERTSSPNVFQAAFPRYTVKISERGDGSEPLLVNYVVSILDESGTVIERASYLDDLAKKFPQMNNSGLMKELYSVARRQALGVDSALDTLLSELSQ